MQFTVVDALRDDTTIERSEHVLVLSPCRLVDALPSRVPKTRCVLLAVAVLLRFAVGAAKPAASPTRQRRSPGQPPDTRCGCARCWSKPGGDEVGYRDTGIATAPWRDH